MAARDEKNRKRSQSGSYYTYGNVAYELQPDYTPYRVREEEEERRREAARIAKEAERENKVSFAKMVGVVIVLFIGCIAFMGMHVMVDQAEVSLRREKSKLEDLKSANAILEAERLGMSEPQPYQVVYINVPKQSYTVQHDTEETKAEASLVDKILDFFKKD